MVNHIENFFGWDDGWIRFYWYNSYNLWIYIYEFKFKFMNFIYVIHIIPLYAYKTRIEFYSNTQWNVSIWCIYLVIVCVCLSGDIYSSNSRFHKNNLVCPFLCMACLAFDV